MTTMTMMNIKTGTMMNMIPMAPKMLKKKSNGPNCIHDILVIVMGLSTNPLTRLITFVRLSRVSASAKADCRESQTIWLFTGFQTSSVAPFQVPWMTTFEILWMDAKSEQTASVAVRMVRHSKCPTRQSTLMLFGEEQSAGKNGVFSLLLLATMPDFGTYKSCCAVHPLVHQTSLEEEMEYADSRISLEETLH